MRSAPAVRERNCAPTSGEHLPSVILAMWLSVILFVVKSTLSSMRSAAASASRSPSA